MGDEDHKVFLRKKNHAYKAFVRNGGPIDRHDEIQHMIAEGSKMVGYAKRRYFSKIGMTPTGPDTGSKRY